jgi:hypothetical protein
LESVAAFAAGQGGAEFALRMAGAAASLRQAMGAPLSPAEHAKLEESLEVARQALKDDGGLSIWMEGWAMNVDRAIQEALKYRSPAGTRSRNSA